MIRRAYLIALGLSVVVSTSLISIVFLYNVYPETWSPSHFPEVDRYMRVNGTDGVGMGNGNGNGTGVAPVQVTPGKWTSETMEPKFGYAMYATDLTYFCNTVRALSVGFLMDRSGLDRLEPELTTACHLS